MHNMCSLHRCTNDLAKGRNDILAHGEPNMHGTHGSSVGEEDMEQGDDDTHLRNQHMHQISEETTINSQIEPPRILFEQPTLRASSRINLSTFGDTKANLESLYMGLTIKTQDHLQ